MKSFWKVITLLKLGPGARILDSKEKEVTGSNLGCGNRTNELIYID